VASDDEQDLGRQLDEAFEPEQPTQPVTEAFTALQRQLHRIAIVGRVSRERNRQVEMWPQPQHHPVISPAVRTPRGAAAFYNVPTEPTAKHACDTAAAAGDVTWFDILIEEVAEALDAAGRRNDADTVTELLQVAAVCVAIVEDIEAQQ